MNKLGHALVQALALAGGMLPGTPVLAQPLPTAKPEEVGLSSERLGRIGDLIKADIAAGAMPGAVLLVARHGKVAYLQSFGRRDPATEAEMTPDTIFRIYSMSKPITTVAAMTLVEDGRISLVDPVSKYIPAFASMKVAVQTGAPNASPSALDLVPARRPITVQDLMRHTSGITYGFFGDLPAKKAYLDAKVTRGASGEGCRAGHPGVDTCGIHLHRVRTGDLR